MISIGANDYKIIYLDTNILRATLEKSESIHKNVLSFLGSKSIFAISIITLIEFSHLKKLIDSFISFAKAIPIIIMKSSSQIYELERNSINSTIDFHDLVQFFLIPTDKNTIAEMTNYLGSKKFNDLCHMLKSDQTATYTKLKNEIENEKNYTPSPEEFFKKRFIVNNGQEYALCFEDKNYMSNKIMNLLIYYTYKVRKKKILRSDPFDFLISSTVPYVDVFITENSQAKTLTMIKENHTFIDHLEILVMKDLRES